ncbi:MAG: hypothetical protein NUW21_03430, partial [Elusimicrobia bacterium]|nr:hypothetical protein [Elusimicrobiota bacterium]
MGEEDSVLDRVRPRGNGAPDDGGVIWYDVVPRRPMSKPEFVHLHNHSEYSLMDGVIRLSD